MPASDNNSQLLHPIGQRWSNLMTPLSCLTKTGYQPNQHIEIYTCESTHKHEETAWTLHDSKPYRAADWRLWQIREDKKFLCIAGLWDSGKWSSNVERPTCTRIQHRAPCCGEHVRTCWGKPRMQECTGRAPCITVRGHHPKHSNWGHILIIQE